MKRIILVFLCLMPLALHARLGESPQDILKRYGVVEKRTDLDTNRWMGTYTFKEYQVMVIFQDERSVCEFVQPLETRDFGDDERQSLMNNIAQCHDYDWAKDDKNSEFETTIWIEKDKPNLASAKKEIGQSSQLIICTKTYFDGYLKRESHAEKQKAAGF